MDVMRRGNISIEYFLAGILNFEISSTATKKNVFIKNAWENGQLSTETLLISKFFFDII